MKKEKEKKRKMSTEIRKRVVSWTVSSHHLHGVIWGRQENRKHEIGREKATTTTTRRRRYMKRK